MNREQVIGNLSSAIKIILLTITPAVSVYLGIDENTSLALLTAITGCLFGLIDMSFPNTMIGGENTNEEP